MEGSEAFAVSDIYGARGFVDDEASYFIGNNKQGCLSRYGFIGGNADYSKALDLAGFLDLLECDSARQLKAENHGESRARSGADESGEILQEHLDSSITKEMIIIKADMEISERIWKFDSIIR